MFSPSYFVVSRRVLWYILTAVVVMNFIIVTYFQLANSITDILSYQGTSKLSSFQMAALQFFKVLEGDKDRFGLVDSSLCHAVGNIETKDFLPEDGKDLDDFFYDPRLTLSVYLNELTNLGQQKDTPVLPFHWTDWIDVTLLNEEKKLQDPKLMTCERIRWRTQRNPDTSPFCKNKDDLSMEEVNSLGYKSKDILPPSVIFGHCKHNNNGYNDVRVYMAKSYVLTYLPKPYKVIILNKERGTYEFEVNQSNGPEQRMIFSGMLDRFSKKILKVSPQSLLKKKVFTVDHLSIFKKLRKTVKPNFMPRSQDVHSMNQIVMSSPSHSKDISLTEASFDYTKEKITQKIEEYEQIKNRTIQQNNFLDGLKDCLLYDGLNEPEYFKMATLNIRERKNKLNDWGWHYDWRFFSDALFIEKVGWTKQERVERTNIILERLLRNWNRFAEEKGIVSWIMHGPLLSWYWDGLMFPFDVDIDIQMPISELVRLSEFYNQTLVVEDPTEGYGRYLIDVGTYIHNRDISHTGNHIDARFVDVDSGIYIDITGLAKSPANLPEEYEKTPIVQKPKDDGEVEVYNDRRKHFYTFDQLLPLHYSMMGGVPLFVPNQIEERLRFEYSHGLDDYEFHGWYFVPKLQLWVMTDKLSKVLPEEQIRKDGKQLRELVIAAAIDMTDQQAIDMLKDDETLMEYYLTRKFTDWHSREREILFTEDGKDNINALKDPEIRAKYTQLTGEITMGKPLRKCLFEYEKFDRMLSLEYYLHNN